MENILELEIKSTGFGGSGIARKEGLVYFVPKTAPGDKILAKVVKENKSFSVCEIEKILEPSPLRTDPECPYFGNCNGCQYQHMQYEAQLAEKQKQVTDLLERIGKTGNLPEITIEASPTPYGYRNSLTFGLKKENGALISCFTAHNGEKLPIDKCPLATDTLNAFKDTVVEQLATMPGNIEKKTLIVKQDTRGMTGYTLLAGRKYVSPEQILTAQVGEKNLSYSCQTFFQTQFYMLEKIAQTMDEWTSAIPEAKKSAFFDIYSGVGTISGLIGEKFKKCILIEENPKCKQHILVNLGQTKHVFLREKAEKRFPHLFHRNKYQTNIVFINPPRSGCDKKLTEALNKTHKQITDLFYLCCEPSVLARDLNRLVQKGNYEVKAIKLFDMFPQTAHVESLVHLVPKNAKKQ